MILTTPARAPSPYIAAAGPRTISMREMFSMGMDAQSVELPETVFVLRPSTSTRTRCPFPPPLLYPRMYDLVVGPLVGAAGEESGLLLDHLNDVGGAAFPD